METFGHTALHSNVYPFTSGSAGRNPETEDGFEVWLNIPENFKAKVKFCGKIITVTKQNGEISVKIK